MELAYIAEDLRDLATPITQIRPDPKNRRVRTKRNLAAIRASLSRFGQLKPIVVHHETNTCVAGNGTLQVAAEMGWTHVAANRWRGITLEEARAFALADNRSAELSIWDRDGLVDELRDLDAKGVELPGLGWSDKELARMLALPEEQTTEPGDPPEIVAITKPGERIELGPHVLHCRDCVEVMRELADASVDAIVTDPPYGLEFMGKDWDKLDGAAVVDDPATVGGFQDGNGGNPYSRSRIRFGKNPSAGIQRFHSGWACEAFRVLKPGGHVIAFAATRTVHRLTCALEDAGFEVRDLIGWEFYSGFPKSLDVSKAIDKAAGAEREKVRIEAENVSNPKSINSGHGVGGGDRPWMEDARERGYHEKDGPDPVTDDAKRWDGWGTALKPALEPCILVRKRLDGTVAANVLKHGTGALNIDACRIPDGDDAWTGPDALPDHDLGRWPANVYHAKKPTRSERDIPGVEAPGGTIRDVGSAQHTTGKRDPSRKDGPPAPLRANHHPTVKPVKLIRWLLRLVTPPGGVVVEPFCGSGTALVAAADLDCKMIAAEMEPAYCDIARARWGAIDDAQE